MKYDSLFHLLIMDIQIYVQLWEPSMVNELSRHPAVQRVIALGTVFALELKSDASDSG